MKRKPSIYDNMTASDLARETRALGLQKPDVITLREWADWLEAEHAKRNAAPVEAAAPRETGLAPVDRRKVERDAYEAKLLSMTPDQLDDYASERGTAWPETGSGKSGNVIKSDKVLTLLEAWDASSTTITVPADEGQSDGDADGG